MMFRKSECLKYLIVGLGNPGDEYQNTRHNIGFGILAHFAMNHNVIFQNKRYGAVTEIKYHSRLLKLVKPSTYMNLSGNAVRYWLQKEKIPISNLLVLVDDVSLPLGILRIRPKGGDGGHNGLKSINQVLGRNDYARLRFGIGNTFQKGGQVNYVLGEWTEEEKSLVTERLDDCIHIIKDFSRIGIDKTMTWANKKETANDNTSQDR
jgi:PTH1 family peptidyl-tRNA hydrolase